MSRRAIIEAEGGRRRKDLMLSQIREMSPNIDAERTAKLAEVWDELLDAVMRRVVAIGEQEVGPLNVDAKAEAIFEMANLTIFVVKQIVQQKAKIKPLEEYTAAEERSEIQSGTVDRKIETTARQLADKIWLPTLRKLLRAVSLQPGKRRRKLIASLVPSETKKMHFVPQFSTRPWTDPRTHKFRVYSLRLDGALKSKPSSPKAWGWAPSIYTGSRESWFSLVESDSKNPYQRLIDQRPLGDKEVKAWVAFLLCQVLRTPRSMKRLSSQLSNWIKKNRFDYPTTPAALGKAFDTIFSNNEAYAQYYRLVVGRKWRVLRAADERSFVKGDNPVARLPVASFAILYPLSPSLCLSIGPDADAFGEKILVERVKLNVDETDAINASLCIGADREVICPPHLAYEGLEAIVRGSLSAQSSANEVELAHWGFDLRSIIL